MPKNWMVQAKLDFYVNISLIWSGLGGMKFVRPEEHSMQSEFPRLWLTAAPVQHGVHAMCPGPGSNGTWSPSLMSLLLYCCFQRRQEMHLSWVLRTLHWIRCSGGWLLWRHISNDVGQHVSVEKSPSVKVHQVTDPLFKNLSLTLVRLLVKWSL